MTTIRAHFDGKALVLDEPVQLPTNVPLTLHIDVPVSAGEQDLEGRLAALAELEKLGEASETHADWSRESIYSGTLDDPR